MTDQPPTEQQLDEYEAAIAAYQQHPDLGFACCSAHPIADAGAVLLAEVRRLRDRVAELEAFAYGCDAEGCVLPHSSWCDAAKKTAAANEGCTCGRPWTGHPQPHAMHCWTVNPPRAEVEEMRKRIAELSAVAPDATQALARRDAEVMRRCAEFVRDTYSGEWAADAAATLERDADIAERGCPGFEAAYQGPIEAERRLGNCKHCGRAHPDATSEATGAPLSPSQSFSVSESAQSPTGTPTGRLGDLPTTEDLASADNPTHLRWGPNDVLRSDDDSVIVMLSGPDREPYWLELDPERAAVLREDLAGPEGSSA